MVAATSLVIAGRRPQFPETDPNIIRNTVTLPVVEKIITALEDPERKYPDLWKEVFFQAGMYDVWDQIWTEVIHGFGRIHLPKYLENKKPTCDPKTLDNQADYEKALIAQFNDLIKSSKEGGYGEKEFQDDFTHTNGSAQSYGCDKGCKKQAVHLSDLIAIQAAIMDSCRGNPGYVIIGEWRAEQTV
ncbi:hypothetical protein EJ05DRAFT_509208, partial [Pseudovirgaria hyperparasitica]